MIVFLYLLLISLSVIVGYLTIFFFNKAAKQLADMRKDAKK